MAQQQTAGQRKRKKVVKQSAAYNIAHGQFRVIDVVGCCCCWALADDVVYTCVYIHACFFFILLFISFTFARLRRSVEINAPSAEDISCATSSSRRAERGEERGNRSEGGTKFFHATSSTSPPPHSRQSRASPADGEVSDGRYCDRPL
jgi:hypothetical protein